MITFPHRKRVVICLLLIVLSFAAYWPIHDNEFINFDDPRYITNNPRIQRGLNIQDISWALTSTYASNWHPLTWISHMADVQLFGLNAGRHHLMNVFFHIANAVLLFLILQRMTRDLWPSAFVAALFALHPLHVESVAWASERKDVLSTFFWMLTMGSYVFYVEKPDTKKYLLTLGFFALGLMAKPMLVTLPFVLLLLDYWPLGRLQTEPRITDEKSKSGKTIESGRQKRKKRKSESAGQASEKISGAADPDKGRQAGFQDLIKEKIPFFALSLLSSIVTVHAQQDAVESLQVIPVTARIANALVSYTGYMWKMIWPQDLAILYPHPGMLPAWKPIAAAAVLALITIFTVRLMRRSPYLAVGWFWYLGTLVPVIGLVQVGLQAMADRYTYVPLIGIFIMISWGFKDAASRRRNREILLITLSCAVLSAFLFLTWKQVGVWKNSVSLFEHTLKTTQNNSTAHLNFGTALVDQGKMDEAISHFREVLRINPNEEKAYSNLGYANFKKGKYDEAIAWSRQALQLNPKSSKAFANIGNSLVRKGRMGEAISVFREAVRTNPDDDYGHYNLGNALASQRSADEAIAHFRESIRINPAFPDAHNNLGNILASQGKLDEAIFQFRESIRIDPAYVNAYINLGLANTEQGKLEEAVAYFKKALHLNPDSAETHYNLGGIMIALKRTDDAIDHFREAVRARPDYAKAHNNLGSALLLKGETDEAVRHFREAVRLQPDYAVARANLREALTHQKKSRE